mgnify:CR=1 FL=1
MALIGINQVQRREKKDTLDKIAQGLSIANSLLGVAVAVPDYLQKRKTGKLAQAESLTKIAQETEVAQPNDPDSFEVPGMGRRKAVPSLQQQIQQTTLAEKQAGAQIPGDDEYGAFIKVSPGSDPNVLKKLYPTRGSLQDAYNRVLGATTVKVEDPAQARKFEYEKGQDFEKKTREKEMKFVAPLNQYAQTEQDAKDVKSAITTKDSLEKMIDDMTALRSKYPGGTIDPRNSEDISRAKLLSTRALLKIKNLETLGVLSKSDIELVNQMIPSNPLEVNPSGVFFGKDPTSAQLDELKKILNEDHTNFLKIRGFHLDSPNKPKVSEHEADNF